MGVPRAQQESQGLTDGPSATGSWHWSLAITIVMARYFTAALLSLLKDSCTGCELFGVRIQP
ncbi:MAG: hypothetical protein ACJ72M_16330 [Propionibacteriaceae bacterium]|jgi:hypothetical protein